MGTVDFTFCPAHQWTFVSAAPVILPFATIECRSEVNVGWRRYLDIVPFKIDLRAHLGPHQVWPVQPAVVNTWWFNPDEDAWIRKL